MTSKTAFRIGLVFALAIIALSVYAFGAMTAPQARGDLPKAYQTVIAFDLARSVTDLHMIFGNAPSACRATLAEQMRVSTWSDSLLFVPMYALFLIFTFLGLRGRDPV